MERRRFKAIPMLVSKILSNNGAVDVWGSGNQKRNYLHAKDCSDIMKQLFDICFTDSPINIGTKNTITIKELVELIKNLTNSETKFNFDLTKQEGRRIKVQILNCYILSYLNTNLKFHLVPG